MHQDAWLAKKQAWPIEKEFLQNKMELWLIFPLIW